MDLGVEVDTYNPGNPTHAELEECDDNVEHDKESDWTLSCRNHETLKAFVPNI